MFTGSLFDVLARFIRIASVVASLFIVGGLIGLLTDEVGDTSKVQAVGIPDPGTGRAPVTIVDIEAPDPGPSVEKVRAEDHASGREFIDDVGDVLMGPFTWLIEGSDGAVRRLLYSGLGLILYAVLLQMLADFMRRQSDASRRAARAATEAAAAAERAKTGTYVSPA
jgi:hypothetical protein